MSQDRTLHSRPAGATAAPRETRTRPKTRAATFRPKTELGRELWALRQKILASGEPLLDADEIEQEVARRRGGIESWD